MAVRANQQQPDAEFPERQHYDSGFLDGYATGHADGFAEGKVAGRREARELEEQGGKPDWSVFLVALGVLALAGIGAGAAVLGDWLTR